MSPYILLVIGLILIFIEFYLPGAIMGSLGGVFILVSLILFAIQSDSPVAIILYTLLSAISIGLIIKFAIWRIRSAKSQRSIYSDASQVGYVASKYDHAAIGKTGVVLSDLKPGGYILVDGKQHQAISQSGYIVRGTEVQVIGGQEESLIVKNKLQRKE